MSEEISKGSESPEEAKFKEDVQNLAKICEAELLDINFISILALESAIKRVFKERGGFREGENQNLLIVGVMVELCDRKGKKDLKNALTSRITDAEDGQPNIQQGDGQSIKDQVLGILGRAIHGPVEQHRRDDDPIKLEQALGRLIKMGGFRVKRIVSEDASGRTSLHTGKIPDDVLDDLDVPEEDDDSE